jgi:hypothetical protein
VATIFVDVGWLTVAEEMERLLAGGEDVFENTLRETK